MDKIVVTITKFGRWKAFDRAAFEEACRSGAERYGRWPVADWLGREEGRARRENRWR